VLISLEFKISKKMISNAIATDAHALEKLVNSAYRGEGAKQGWTTEADLLDGTRITKEVLEDLLQKPGTAILKYEYNGEILGCVELRKEASKLYLGMLSVKPNTQGKGIGKKLLTAAEEHAKKHECSSIFMTVIDGRTELIDWYIRHGYRLTGERKPFIIPDERWGIPKKQLEFVVLEKTV
jgi:ribosomal protein S18 acetylase RimI-like enzyme